MPYAIKPSVWLQRFYNSSSSFSHDGGHQKQSLMEIGKLINLQKIRDLRGNLTVAQKGEILPFVPQRVYWVYDIPSGGCRGGHAHKQCREVIIAVSGSFEVSLDNGTE